MSSRFEFDQVNASSLIEGLFTLISSAGLPAYLGWHGDPATALFIYSAGAGLALTVGISLLHRSPSLADPFGLLFLWGFQTLIVFMVGGTAFTLASFVR